MKRRMDIEKLMDGKKDEKMDGMRMKEGWKEGG